MYERWESHWPSEKNTLLLVEPWPDRKSTETAPGPSRALRLAALFEGSEVRVGVSETDRIRDRIFDKLLINCSINSIGALTGADIGQTCVEDQLLNHYCGTWFSRRQLWRALYPSALEHTAESIISNYRCTFGLRSSMLQDIARRRPTEKNEIVRSLVELGAAHGVATPRLEMAADLLDTVERITRIDNDADASTGR